MHNHARSKQGKQNTMKKSIICAISALCVFMVFADTGSAYRDVYTMKVALKVPYLKNGVRTYSSQTLQGCLYVEFDDPESEFSDSYAVLTNKKTKVVHTIDFGGARFINMIGKSQGKNDKYVPRTIPTVLLEGYDYEIEGNDPHELIQMIVFAGSGSVKETKTKTTGCVYCGEPSTTTTYCRHITKMSGSVVGYMDCECPDEEDGWTHTLIKTLCGFLKDEDGDCVRSHNASFWGTWSAEHNKKLSGEID